MAISSPIHPVTEYAYNVLNNKIITGHRVKQACQRHLDDLSRQGTIAFPFLFDEGKANRIINFAERLTLVEGAEAKSLRLMDWQKFVLGSLFGWVHRDTGYRRYRQSYVQVSRQQGKSLLNGILGTYCSGFDGYKYGEINIAATKLKQSKIVYNEIVKFIDSDPDLAELFKVKDYKSIIEAINTKCVINALSKDNKLDGFRSYLAIIDEYHQHPNNEIYNALLYGQRNLRQCLMSIITTAGEDFNSPCYDMYNYCLNILDDPSSNEQLFVYIAQMDKDDDIWNPDNWIKCMPNINDDMKQTILVDAHKAKAIGGKDLSTFMTKVFNIWCTNAEDNFVDIAKWKANASDLTLEDMRGKSCFVGIDLSGGGSGDLISLAFEFPLESNKFFVESTSFMAREHLKRKMETDNAPYAKWADNGLLILTEGQRADYKRILQYLREVQDEYDITYRMICYDPHGINMILDDLDSFGCDVVEIKQSARALNEATLDFKLSVNEGIILYNRKNELLTWSVGNAKLEYNSFREAKIAKIKNNRTKRIDPVDAIIDAHVMAMLQKEKVELPSVDDVLSKYWD